MLKLSWTDYPEKFDDDSLVAGSDFEPPLSSWEGGEAGGHLLIKGDNYPVLKKLSTAYSEKVDFIYIDPPYNTGNDFVYNDKFYVRDAHGEADRHSQWLS